MVNNNAGNGDARAGRAARRPARSARSSARSRGSPTRGSSTSCTAPGEIELELVPQGNLAERMRAAGAGIGAFFSPTGVGTPLAEGKEHRTIDGRDYVLEYPIRGDVALIKAHRADTVGNLVYRKTARNFGPVMATARRAHRSCRSTRSSSRRARPGGGRHPGHLRRPGRASACAGRHDHRAHRPHARWTGASSPTGWPRDIPHRLLRQPRHRPADDRRRLPAHRRRRHAAHRERHARHGPRGARRRDRSRPHQRRQAPGHRDRRRVATSTTPTRSR